MATQNFFALLGDDDTDDPSVVIARAASPKAAEKPAPPGAKKLPPPQHQVPAKLPTKPLPPAQAVKERQIAQSDGGRGRGGRGGRSGGRGNYINRDQEGNFTRQGREGGFEGSRGNHSDRYNGNNRESSDLQGGRGSYGGNSAGGVTTYRAYGDALSTGEEGEGGRQSDSGRGRGRGGGRGRGYGYGGEGEERSRRRDYDRRSGSGRGNELKRDGAGRGNWGTDVDQVPLQESVDASFVEEDKPVPEIIEKKPEAETGLDSMNAEEKKEDEEEDNEMTLDEYEKVLIEKRKALEALKAQERRVILDKDFESMQLVDRKQDDDAFIKLGLDKEKGKKKEINEKEEKVKKSVSINEFLKPNEGEEYYSPTGRRGRGRGRSDRGGYRGGYGDSRQYSAPRIEDPGQFPTLGGK